MTKKVKKKFQKMYYSEVKQNNKLKKFARKKTMKTIRMFQDVSSETTALVERSSNIWENETKCYSRGPTRSGSD